MNAMRTKMTELEARAGAVAGTLGALANDKRLMILCELVESGECTVGALAKTVALSQSALSQHLAKMRDEGIVIYRRDAQTLWYRIADERIERLLGVLHELYCRPRRKN
jgi:ArsR family transcriptional regulator, virulence genes transcriptional regulator